MRRSRRGGGSGIEFGGSGEDSFVAVVVTKLTGALLFILLLTMVIMALIPKATELGQESREKTEPKRPLAITTPDVLPDAIAGRPYRLALAATGVQGEPHWSVLGESPDWLTLDPDSGRLEGTPATPTEVSLTLTLKVADSASSATQTTRIDVLSAHPPEPLFSWARIRRSSVPWQAWIEQGVGFLILWLVHLVGMNVLASLERNANARLILSNDLALGEIGLKRRFILYRILVRGTTLAIAVSLLAWLVLQPSLGR